MQKNSITNKVTPCGSLPFSVVYWWVQNLTLNSEADRQFIISKTSQNGTIAIDAWRVLINSGTLEADASLTKAEFLSWLDCGKQPTNEQLKIIVESLVLGNWDYYKENFDEVNEELQKMQIKYNDVEETVANNVIQKADVFSGDVLAYRETTKWADGSAMDDTKIDGIIYRVFDNKYYVLAEYAKGGKVEVKIFGKTDTPTNTTATFKRAIAFLEKIGKGILLIPEGVFELNEPLIISKHYIGIKGVGIEATTLFFRDCSGITLSSYVDFSLAAISDLHIKGTKSEGSIGINLPNSNFYFLEKFLVSEFDLGIYGNKAVLTKLTDFSVFFCNKGIYLTNGSYFFTIFNGNVRACRDYGIKDEGNGIKISYTDVEAIGVYNHTLQRYEEGTAIISGAKTVISDCHIETSGFGIKIDDGGCTVKNTFFGGVLVGIAQNKPNVSGNVTLEELRFAGYFDSHIDMPTLSFYKIIDCQFFNEVGNEAEMIASLHPLYGIIEKYKYTAAGYEKSFSGSNMTIKNDFVIKGVKFLKTIDVGTVEANSMVSFTAQLPAGRTLSEYESGVVVNIQSFNLPYGLTIAASALPSSIDHVRLYVTNSSDAALTLGSKTFIFTVFN